MGQTATISTTGASTGLNAYTQVQAGKNNAVIDEFNAKVSDLQAGDAIARGVEAANRSRRQTRRLIGAQRASLAAQGVVVDEGSGGAIVDQTAEFGEADAAAIHSNAVREAWGYQVQSAESRIRAKQARMAGRQAAASTLLTGAANMDAFATRSGLYERGAGSGGGYSNSIVPSNRPQGPAR